MWQLLESGVDVGGGLGGLVGSVESGVDVGGGRGLVGLVEPSKLTGMRHYNVLTWPKNPKNTISNDLNFNNF